MPANAPLDSRLRDVVVVLRHGDRVRPLTAAESVRVLERFDQVRHEAARWRLKLGRPGRLLLVDEQLCEEIAVFLQANSET